MEFNAKRGQPAATSHAQELPCGSVPRLQLKSKTMRNIKPHRVRISLCLRPAAATDSENDADAGDAGNPHSAALFFALQMQPTAKPMLRNIPLPETLRIEGGLLPAACLTLTLTLTLFLFLPPAGSCSGWRTRC